MRSMRRALPCSRRYVPRQHCQRLLFTGRVSPASMPWRASSLGFTRFTASSRAFRVVATAGVCVGAAAWAQRRSVVHAAQANVGDVEEGHDGPHVYTVVLTGGPCAGKSTALAHLSEALTERGYKVYTVPEVPTIFLMGGGDYVGTTPAQLIRFEENLLRAQMMLEDAFVDIAKSMDRKAVVICDRGTMDVSAYLPPETWQVILDEGDYNTVSLRDKRYDSVVHLVTAADGAEKFYTTGNNAARRESPEQARELDSKVLQAWVGHPKLFVVDNSTEFSAKIERVSEAIFQVIGEPYQRGCTRHYLLEGLPQLDDNALNVQSFDVEQYTLAQDATDAQAWVRRRGQDGNYVYTHGIRRLLHDGRVVSSQRTISGRQYAELRRMYGTDACKQKRVHTFTWGSQSYVVEEHKDRDQVTMEVNVVREDRALGSFPPFVRVQREVKANEWDAEWETDL